MHLCYGFAIALYGMGRCWLFFTTKLLRGFWRLLHMNGNGIGGDNYTCVRHEPYPQASGKDDEPKGDF